jgi:hypothetical protein
MSTYDPQFENIIQHSGGFTATYAPKLCQYYLYFNGKCVGQINNGEHPIKMYGSVDKWILFVVKRSKKRRAKIYELQAELANESCDLDCLIKEGEFENRLTRAST